MLGATTLAETKSFSLIAIKTVKNTKNYTPIRKHNTLKIPNLGYVKLAEKVRFNGKINSVTISQQGDKFYASFSLSIPQAEFKTAPHSDLGLGIDIGIQSMVSLSNGLEVKAPKPLAKLSRKLVRLSRQLSKKQHPKTKGDKTPKSANYKKASLKLSKLHKRIVNIERVYQALCETIATSISSQSRSLGIETPVSLNKELLENKAISLAKNNEELTALDENYAIVTGLCRKVKLPYLMKWERFGEVIFGDEEYHYVGAYALEKDYEDWSDNRPNNQTVKSSQLIGGGGCPHCGSPFAFAMCDCGQVFCIDGLGEAVCPKCQQDCFFGFDPEGGDFEINRARG